MKDAKIETTGKMITGDVRPFISIFTTFRTLSLFVASIHVFHIQEATRPTDLPAAGCQCLSDALDRGASWAEAGGE